MLRNNPAVSTLWHKRSKPSNYLRYSSEGMNSKLLAERLRHLNPNILLINATTNCQQCKLPLWRKRLIYCILSKVLFVWCSYPLVVRWSICVTYWIILMARWCDKNGEVVMILMQNSYYIQGSVQFSMLACSSIIMHSLSYVINKGTWPTSLLFRWIGN